MEMPIIKDIAVIIALTVIVLLICSRFGIPTIVGLLVTGVVSGPFGLSLVQNDHTVEILAQIGIMLLLFTIGLEFSLKKLLEVKRFFFIGGTLQVFLTVFIGFLVGQFLGRPFGESIFLGFLLSMSSTAIVLKTLSQQGKADTPYGRICLAILIFQDIIAVPMMLLTPTLADKGSIDTHFIYSFAIGIVIIFFVFLAATKIIPRLFYEIAKTRSRELFSLSLLMICFAVAWISTTIGLSLVLGAFLAGLIISETDYRHEAIGHILPLQDIFSSLFFVSIGMSLDIKFVWANPLQILLITAGIIFMKSVVVAFAALLMGLPLRVMILSGIALAQIGEFSFVLANAGSQYGIGGSYYNQLFLAVALLSMAVTPSLIGVSHYIVKAVLKLPLPARIKSGLDPHATTELKHELKDHIIIVGFGLSGRNVARIAKKLKVPYAVIDINPETVRLEHLKGEPIHFGDATQDSILNHMNVGAAKAIIVVINDQKAAGDIVAKVRKLNTNAYIIVRTRFIKDMTLLYSLGASEVIPDEFGSSIEVLEHLAPLFPGDKESVQEAVSTLRHEGYKAIRMN